MDDPINGFTSATAPVADVDDHGPRTARRYSPSTSASRAAAGLVRGVLPAAARTRNDAPGSGRGVVKKTAF